MGFARLAADGFWFNSFVCSLDRILGVTIVQAWFLDGFKIPGAASM